MINYNLTCSVVQKLNMFFQALLRPNLHPISKICFLIGLACLFFPLGWAEHEVPAIRYTSRLGGFGLFSLLSVWFIPQEFAKTQFTPSPQDAPCSGTDCLPNFFIVGAARCATTSLFEAIAQHPDVFCCPIKEPNYFCFDINCDDAFLEDARKQGSLIETRFETMLTPPRVAVTVDYDAYLDLYRGWRGQTAVGEASTSYLPSEAAAEEIAALRPDARIIIVLRNPIERTYSDYLMHRQLGHELGHFRKFVTRQLEDIRTDSITGRNVLLSSFYAEQIRRYQAHFPPRQILFLLFEELVEQPGETLARVFRHIGVDPDLGADIRIGWENKSREARFGRINATLLRTGKRGLMMRTLPKSVRHRLRGLFYRVRNPPPQPENDRALLASLFRENITETATLIDRDLGQWLTI
jgi:hypothetical protein